MLKFNKLYQKLSRDFTNARIYHGNSLWLNILIEYHVVWMDSNYDSLYSLDFQLVRGHLSYEFVHFSVNLIKLAGVFKFQHRIQIATF